MLTWLRATRLLHVNNDSLAIGRAHAEDAVAYETPKRRLAGSFRNDRVAYTEAKGEFVRGVLERAGAEEGSKMQQRR